MAQDQREEMARYKQPSFLRGMFVWNVLGYFHAERPPMDLLAPEALASDNPWLVVAAVLEHAKRGDHSHIPRLQAYLHPSSGEGLQRASIHLIGDAGREADLAILQALMEQGPDPIRAYAAQAASMAGRLWLVPHMLDAWKRVTSRNHHDMIGNAISSLLEAPGGEIAINTGSYNINPEVVARLKNPMLREFATQRAAEQPLIQFQTQVSARYNELRTQLGNHAVLWEGQPFSVRSLVEEMYRLVSDPAAQPLHGLFIPMRHKFEGATGINCSSCFRNGVLQPLNAAAVLENFLESDGPAKYDDGVRYFFAHGVPE